MFNIIPETGFLQVNYTENKTMLQRKELQNIYCIFCWFKHSINNVLAHPVLGQNLLFQAIDVSRRKIISGETSSHSYTGS